jgi:4-amino-4-deoxy-L-arabinose transferase-like glycosyltransferase
MDRIIDFLRQNHRVFYIVAALLCIPAFLINLDLVPLSFVPDEAIRGLVALEMIISENFIVPTLNGEFYYNKPPFFNWIIILFFKLTGSYSIFTMRIITVMALAVFGYVIYHFVKKHYNKEFALFNAFMFITCGRILLWDSFIALIDITFSLTIYLNFMLIFHYYQKQKFLTLFVVSYLITTAAFLMKALPSVAFQGLTLLVFFIYNRDFKRLFAWQHFVGFFTFAGLLFLYYYLYSGYNTLDELFPRLLSESTSRTVVKYGWWQSFLHLFTFPVEQLYHFAPWSFLIVFLFSKKAIKEIFANPFLKYNFMVFAVNIPIYWTSPEVFPRFILMLAPLIFLLFSHFAIWKKDQYKLTRQWIEILFLVVSVVFTFGILYIPFHPDTQQIPHLWLKTLALFFSFAVASYLYFRINKSRMIIFVIMMLLLRISFNWFAFPPRADHLDKYIDDAVEMAKMTKGKELFLYKGTIRDNPNSFYITRERMKILKITDNKNIPGALYLSEEYFLQDENYETLFEYTIFFEKRKLFLVKFTNPENDS